MIDAGEKIHIEATYSLDGSPADPATPVIVVVQRRGGDAEEFTASQIDTGVFRIEYTPQEAGAYNYTFYSEDDSIAQGVFRAQPIIAEKS